MRAARALLAAPAPSVLDLRRHVGALLGAVLRARTTSFDRVERIRKSCVALRRGGAPLNTRAALSAELRDLTCGPAFLPELLDVVRAFTVLMKLTNLAEDVETAAQRAAAGAALALFRDYLMYHLKAAKTYLHARMRRRAEDLQRVLNRALPPAEGDKKTAGGKPFVAREKA